MGTSVRQLGVISFVTVAWVLGCAGGELAWLVRAGPRGWCASLAVHVACVVGNARGAGAWHLRVFGLQAFSCTWRGRTNRLKLPLARLVRDVWLGGWGRGELEIQPWAVREVLFACRRPPDQCPGPSYAEDILWPRVSSQSFTAEGVMVSGAVREMVRRPRGARDLKVAWLNAFLAAW